MVEVYDSPQHQSVYFFVFLLALFWRSVNFLHIVDIKYKFLHFPSLTVIFLCLSPICLSLSSRLFLYFYLIVCVNKVLVFTKFTWQLAGDMMILLCLQTRKEQNCQIIY